MPSESTSGEIEICIPAYERCYWWGHTCSTDPDDGSCPGMCFGNEEVGLVCAPAATKVGDDQVCPPYERIEQGAQGWPTDTVWGWYCRIPCGPDFGGRWCPEGMVCADSFFGHSGCVWPSE